MAEAFDTPEALVDTPSLQNEIYELISYLRHHFNPYDLPSVEASVTATYISQPGVVVKLCRGQVQGIAKITLTTPVHDPP